jgi:hypothetical protein
VAANRIVGDIPRVDLSLLMNGRIDEFMKKHESQMSFVHDASRELINLKYAGETFNDPDLQSFLARLLMLREIGYRFPDSVLDQVREEIKRKNESADR